MKRFGVLLASASLGAVLAASNPALAQMGGFGGRPMGGFGGRHMGIGGHGGMLAGRNVAVGGWNRGGWNGGGWNRGGWRRAGWGWGGGWGRRGWGWGGGWGWGTGWPAYAGLGLGVGYGLGALAYGYPYGYGSGYPGYAYGYGYPNYGYSYGYPGTDYSSAAPLVTGRSVAAGQNGTMCSTAVKTCVLNHASFIGNGCSCKVTGGRSRGTVSP